MEAFMTGHSNALAVNPADETIDYGPMAVRFLLTGENSTGSVAAFELTIGGGQRLAAPAHSHDHYEETIYGLEGVLTWTVGGQPIEIAAGQALCIPRGAIHRFDNLGSQPAKVLCVITPAAIGPQYFRDVLEVMKASVGGPPDRARVAEVMRRHGLTPAPPPPAA
jgi:quercetin dioxygenase-like cupin family protein